MASGELGAAAPWHRPLRPSREVRDDSPGVVPILRCGAHGRGSAPLRHVRRGTGWGRSSCGGPGGSPIPAAVPAPAVPAAVPAPAVPAALPASDAGPAAGLGGRTAHARHRGAHEWSERRRRCRCDRARGGCRRCPRRRRVPAVSVKLRLSDRSSTCCRPDAGDPRSVGHCRFVGPCFVGPCFVGHSFVGRCRSVAEPAPRHLRAYRFDAERTEHGHGNAACGRAGPGRGRPVQQQAHQ